MRPIFSPSARVSVACPSRVGVGTLGGLPKSGLLEALLDDFPRAPLGSAGSDDFLATKVESEGSGLAFALSVFGKALADLACLSSCGFAYKSITSREGLLSREAV